MVGSYLPLGSSDREDEAPIKQTARPQCYVSV